MILTKLGGRRFWLTLGCGVVTSALVWFGKIDGTIYRDVIIATVAAFITGATAQKFSGQG